MYKYKKLRKYSSDCHIFEFSTDDCRLDVSVGNNKMEYISKIDGTPNKDEEVILKVNGGFSALDNHPEYISSISEEDLYYTKLLDQYPIAVLWNNGILSAEYTTNPERYVDYQLGAKWAIRCMWTLVINGKRNYHMTEDELFVMPEQPRKRNQRTLLGQKHNGDFVLCVVDKKGLLNRGLTIKQSSELMIDLGCKIAFDIGNRSSQMIYRNETVNKSIFKERRSPSALIVYSKNKHIYNTYDGVERKGIIISNGGSHIRRHPRIYKSKEIRTIPKLSQVNILDITPDGWYKIKYDNDEGYIHGTHIKMI